jgi:hypothetical protein
VGNTVSIDDMPDVVHEPYAFLLDKTGCEPIVERSGYGKILLTHLGERTKMTIKFRLDGRKWRWEKSHLFIDGKQQPLASGWDMYVAIYKDPDNGRRNFTPEGARKAAIPASQEVDETYLPTAVAKELGSLRKLTVKETTTIVPTVVSEKNQYLITLADGESGQKFVFTFGFEANTWQVVDMLLVNASGYDVTSYVGESQLDAFLSEIMGIAGRASQVTYNPGGSTQQAAATNSTMVRKSTVIRV